MLTDMKDPIALLEERGGAPYDGEPLSHLQHALQSAALARKAHAAPALVLAALLHDIGHLIQGDALRKIDDRGARYLAQFFGPAIYEPVRLLHDARRYLARDPDYSATLTDRAQQRLQHAGGAMSSVDAEVFRALPFADDALRLCRWDDLAHDASVQPEGLGHYLVLQQQLRHPSAQSA